jgi:nitrogen regulatory protein P-II 1
MYMLIMVLDDSEHLNDVLQAWVSAGVPGVTILESTGINRVLPRDQAGPMFAGFSHIFGSGRVGHNTIFAVIESMELAETAVRATEAVVGDLNEPNTGIVFVLPVAKSWGIPEPYAK